MPSSSPIQAEAVFEILVRENADMLVTYLRAVVWDPTVVDDLFQETMLVAWRRLADYDQSRPFGPWLRGIAARQVLAHARKAQRDLMVCDEQVLEYLDQQVQRISQRDGDCWDEKLLALRECVAALPEVNRQAISLRYLEGRTAERIAALLDVTREAVKKRLQRGRAQLLDCLRRKGVLLEPSP
jgi:RNA polymerase sigma-70 factor (ECF subfamily)